MAKENKTDMCKCSNPELKLAYVTHLRMWVELIELELIIIIIATFKLAIFVIVSISLSFNIHTSQ